MHTVYLFILQTVTSSAGHRGRGWIKGAAQAGKNTSSEQLTTKYGRH